MSLYPNDSGFNNLYPNESEVRNPMIKDLNANGYDIFNLNQLDLVAPGELNGVITINGQTYPPLPTPLPTSRVQTFNFPTVLNPLPSGGGTSLIFNLYNNGASINTQLAVLFGSTDINLIQLSMPVNVMNTANPDQGKFDIYLYVNGVQKQSSGQFITGPNSTGVLSPYNQNSVEASVVPVVTFILQRGVDYVGISDVIDVYGAGGYNYTYYFNYNLLHAEQSVPTICSAIGFS